MSKSQKRSDRPMITPETRFRANELHDEEFDKAALRIGSDSADAMRWLLGFADRDLKSASMGDQYNLQYEALHFEMSFGPFGGQKEKQMWFFDARFVPPSLEPHPTLSGNTKASKSFEKPWLPLDIESLQKEVRKYIGYILNHEGVVLKINPIDIALTPDGPDGEYGFAVALDPKDPIGPFQLALLYTLHNHAGLIRRCPACQRVFLADRRNQGFCSRKCQTRTATRRFRIEHGLHTGKRGRPRKGSLTTKLSTKGNKRHGTKRK